MTVRAKLRAMQVTVQVDPYVELPIDVGDNDLTKPWTGCIVEHEPREPMSAQRDIRPRHHTVTMLSDELNGYRSNLTVEGQNVTGTPFVAP